jgi:hypothetical protein
MDLIPRQLESKRVGMCGHDVNLLVAHLRHDSHVVCMLNQQEVQIIPNVKSAHRSRRALVTSVL